MSSTYFMPTKIVFGSGALDTLHEQQLPGQQALIVVSAGRSVKNNGYLTRVIDQLTMASIESVVYDKIQPNPVKESIMEGAGVARMFHCDFVIGLGGGSSIDASKAIAIMATNPGDYWDYVNGGSGKGKPIANQPLPVVAITTTAGTGTEADPWTVVTKSETKEKIGFGYDGTYPTLSIVDPELTLSVPEKLTAYQGFDTLFHTAEGYLATCASAMSEPLSLRAIDLIGQSLVKCVNQGNNLKAREDVSMANTLGGLVQSLSSCIAMHSLAHALSAYDPQITHGAGLIAISNAFFSFIAARHVADEKMITMAQVLGNSVADTPEDFVDELQKLQEQCHVSNLSLKGFGVKEDELVGIAQNAMDTMGGLFKVTPVEMTVEDCTDILKKSY